MVEVIAERVVVLPEGQNILFELGEIDPVGDGLVHGNLARVKISGNAITTAPTGQGAHGDRFIPKILVEGRKV